MGNVDTKTLVIGLICSLTASIGAFAALYLMSRKRSDTTSTGPERNDHPTIEQLREAREFLEQQMPENIEYEEDRNRFDLSFPNGRYVLAASHCPAFTPPYSEESIQVYMGGNEKLYLNFEDGKYAGYGCDRIPDEAMRIYEIVWGRVNASKQAA